MLEADDIAGAVHEPEEAERIATDTAGCRKQGETVANIQAEVRIEAN